jgi:hypothetical protein
MKRDLNSGSPRYNSLNDNLGVSSHKDSPKFKDRRFNHHSSLVSNSLSGSLGADSHKDSPKFKNRKFSHRSSLVSNSLRGNLRFKSRKEEIWLSRRTNQQFNSLAATPKCNSREDKINCVR